MKGEDVFKSVYNYSSKLYYEVPVTYLNGSEKQVEQFSLSISDFLRGLTYAAEGARSSKNIKSISYGRNVEGAKVEHVPLDVGYRTPDTICFTRNANESLNTLRKYDLLSFDPKVFQHFWHCVFFQVKIDPNLNFRSIAIKPWPAIIFWKTRLL